jgi:hypothetical protein
VVSVSVRPGDLVIVPRGRAEGRVGYVAGLRRTRRGVYALLRFGGPRGRVIGSFPPDELRLFCPREAVEAL